MTCHVFQGGSKIQEARLIFQDLSDKYPTTCTILNGKALCSTHMGNFEDAEGLLLESLNKVDQLRWSQPSFSPKRAFPLQIGVANHHSCTAERTPMLSACAFLKQNPWHVSLCLHGTAQTIQDAKDTETLTNLTVCSLNLGKPATRYLK
jgi:hypothetical protein